MAMMQTPATDAVRTGPVVFISTMDGDPWGGSEELWQATALRLATQGVRVRACVEGWSPPHRKVQALIDAGVEVMLRPRAVPLPKRLLHKLTRQDRSLSVVGVEKWLKADPPALIVLNEQFAFPSYDLTEMFVANGWRYIVVTHAFADHWWPNDTYSARYLGGMNSAEKFFFVSEGNRKFARKQIGFDVSRTGILRNTFGVEYGASIAWPETPATECLSMACVGRLDPRSKGQDLIIEALASDVWKTRNWRLGFYGAGAWREVITRMVREAGLEDRMTVVGHMPISDIFRTNHILVQPSRAEGLPITIVEAMLAGRPVATVDVAGNAELLQDGVSGFVEDAPAVKCIARLMETVWRRREDLERMGQAARIDVQREIPADPAGVFADVVRGFLVKAPQPV